MKKLFILSLLLSLPLYSQTDLFESLNYYPTEPNTTGFEIYENHQPANSKGIVPVTIPLHEISTDILQIPISIDYISSSGILVNQKSSEVGLGWLLNINNFFIEHEINGTIDLGQHYNAQTEYNNLEQRRNSSDHNTVSFLYPYLKDVFFGNNTVDILLDEYSYNFNGHSGNFLFDENGDVIDLNTSNSDLKIEKTISGFSVLDSKGIKYIFDKKIEYFSSEPIIKLIKVRWYLSSVLLPNNKDILNFNYTDGSNQITNGVKVYDHNRVLKKLYHITEHIEDVNDQYLRPEVSSAPILSSTYHKLNLLSSIEFSKGKLEFNYSFYNSSAKINDIKIYNKVDSNYNHIKTFSFHNSNNYSNQLGDTTSVRIRFRKLDAISFNNKLGEELYRYSFVYDDRNIPDVNAYTRDYWGYYLSSGGLIPGFTYYNETRNQQYTFSGQNRRPQFLDTQAGILKKIIYPTGGVSEFVYEPNYYCYKKENQNVIEVNKGFTLTAVGSNPTISSPKPIDQRSFTLSHGQVQSPGGISVTYTCSRFSTSNSNNLPYIRVIGESFSGNHIVFNRPAERKSGTFNLVNLPPGTYTATAFVGDASLDPNDPEPPIFGTAAVELSLHWTEFQETNIPQEDILLTGGGLRIKELKSYNSIKDVLPDYTTKYFYGEKTINNIGVGKFMGINTRKHLFKNINGDIVDENHIIGHFLTRKDYEIHHGILIGGHCVQDDYESESLQLSSDPQFPIQHNGSSTHYSKVSLIKYDNNGQKLGKTEYYYTEPKKKKILSLDGYFHHSSQAEKDLIMYSKYDKINLNKEIYYNSANKKVKEKQYIYNISELKQLKRLKIALTDNVLSQSGCYATNREFERRILDGNIKYYLYDEILEIEKLTKLKNIDFFNDSTVVTITGYYYSNPKSFRLSKSDTKLNSGKTISSKTFYPDHKNNLTDLSIIESKAIDSLIKQHRIAEPIQTETTISDSNGTELSKTIQRTNYVVTPEGLTLPKEVQTLKGVNSTTQDLENRVVYHVYDDRGNPIELSKSDGTHIYYIWGYNKQYPLAKIDNFTSTQAQAIQTLISTSVSASSQDDDTCKDGCNEANLRGALKAIQDSPALSNSQMTYYTYDPLVGVTSITDARGYTSYYEYDEFNRLKHVKDAQGNILSKTEYKYKSE